MSQHKATEERRYRLELVAVIGIGLALAVIAVAAILSIDASPDDDFEDFNGLDAHRAVAVR